jgi:hypothetical protein
MTKYVLIWIVMNAGSVATGTAEFDVDRVQFGMALADN